MKIAENLSELIGKTPLLRLHDGLYAKLEFLNPGGSAKDRVALSMILDAEAHGILSPGATIIEPTSGNTGIGLAWVGTGRGYRVILTMPETMSVERQKLVKAYGAEVVLTEGAKGMSGAIAKAEALRDEIPGAVILGQFDNPANPLAHYNTTGPEIWDDTDGTVDILVAGVGTGGTLCGAGRYLKEKNPEIQIVAVEPEASPVLSGGTAAPHKIQGIGANFIPKTTDVSLIDRIIPVSDRDAMDAARKISKKNGILIGISGGAALWAAEKLANSPENQGKTIVVIFPDTGERYLSTELFRE